MMKPTRENFMDGKFAIHVKDYKQYLLLILYLNNTGFSTPTYPKFRYSYREDYPYFWIKYGKYSKYLTSDATAAQLPVVEFEDFAPVKEFFSIEPINKESETVKTSSLADGIISRLRAMQNEISYFGRDLEIYQQALADAIDVVGNMAPMTQKQALSLCSIQDIKSTFMEKTPLDEEFIQSVVDEIPRLGDKAECEKDLDTEFEYERD